MSIYTIKRVLGEPRPWSGQNGDFLAYTVDLEEEAGPTYAGIEWSRKTSSSAPEEGDRIAGHIEPNRNPSFPEKFKMDYDATKELSGGSQPRKFSASKTAKAWEPEQDRDPERSARILRQHSQGLAVQVLIADPSIDVGYTESFLKCLKEWTDWFDQDVIQAGQAAKEGKRLPSVTAGGRSETAASPSQPVDISHQECMEALNTAGLIEAVPAAKVADYMLSELPPDRLARAIANLTYAADTQLQGKTLSALKTATETHFGEPLSKEPPHEDDIPF